MSQQRACTQSTVHKSAVSTSIEQRPAAPRTAFPTAGITRPNFDVRCAHASDVLRTVYRCVSLSVACDTTLLRDTYACFVILGSGVDLIRRARHTQHTTVDTTEPTATGVFNLPTAHAPSSHVRYTSRTRFVTASRIRSDAGPCAARAWADLRPLARGQTPRELRSSRRSEGSG